MIRIDYFDCISPLPLHIFNVGSIKSIKLIDIAKISYYTYAQYVTHIRMTPEDYFDTYFKDKEIDIDIIINSTKFDLVLTDDQFRSIITSALNFFFVEEFKFYPDYCAFINYTVDDDGNKHINGIINKDNYSDILSIILQRIHILPDENEVDDVSKIKNKLGKKIYEKMIKRRKKFKKVKAQNPNYTLPNIIAAVASKSESLNWNNIWSISIFQLFDVFERMRIIDTYNIASIQVAAWGDKNNKFKFGAWTDNIYDKKDTE